MPHAEMASLFNMCRLMADIAVEGMPVAIDIIDMLRDKRATGGTDGVYPTHMTDNRLQLNPESLAR
jgi:hypothetical protein